MAVRPEIEDGAQPRIETVGRAVHVAIGRRAHVAAFAAESRPAALGRADDAVKHANRVEQAGVAIDLPHCALLAEIERDRGPVARTVDDGDHHGRLVPGEGRDQIGKPGVIVVMRQSDDRNIAVEAEEPAQFGGSADAFLQRVAAIRRGVILEDQIEARGKLLQHGAKTCGDEQRIIIGRQPCNDLLGADAHVFHQPGQGFERRAGSAVGMFLSGEPFFLVVADQARAAFGRHLDERCARVVEAADTDAGEISCFATRQSLRPAPAIAPPRRGCSTDEYSCAENTAPQAAAPPQSPPLPAGAATARNARLSRDRHSQSLEKS